MLPLLGPGSSAPARALPTPPSLRQSGGWLSWDRISHRRATHVGDDRFQLLQRRNGGRTASRLLGQTGRPPLRSAMAASGLPNGSYAASRALTRATVAVVHTAAPAGVGKPSAVSFPASCRSDNEPSGSSRVMIGASEAA
jgi:hypothetical protein